LGEAIEMVEGFFRGVCGERLAVLFDEGQAQCVEMGVESGLIGFHW
jgi:hypothetical protein